MEGDEKFRSDTIEDWVREGDHVAVVHITKERELPLGDTDRERGEGYVGREVTARVTTVVWSHPKAPRPLTSDLRWIEAGWVFKGGVGKNKHRLGFGETPYIMPGHSYLVVFRWTVNGCPGRIDPGDNPAPPHWAPLGSGAAVPFDGHLGRGEFEGRLVEDASANERGKPFIGKRFRAAMSGKSTDWVGAQLRDAAAQHPEWAHKPGPTGCGPESFTAPPLPPND